MSAITFSILSTPRRSKGWARYAAANQNGCKIIQSTTGNEWVSSDKSCDAEQGSLIVIRVQVMLRVGKNRTAREEISTETHTLIAEDGAMCDIELRPGSQGVRIGIFGARPASDIE